MLSIFSAEIFYTDVQILNLISASATLFVGCLIYFHNRKSVQNRIAFFLALLLSFWAFTVTMSDIMRDVSAALFWLRTAFLGPLLFCGVLVIFSYEFPKQEKNISLRKALLIMLPSLLALPFIYTRYNVVSVSFKDWGTDFVPGPLYMIGLPYAVVYMLYAFVRFVRARNASDDPLHRAQIKLVSAASMVVLATLLVTNVVLPLAFNYTEAGPYSAAASLVFVILMCYAIYAKGALVVKSLAAEFFGFVLCFIALATVLNSDSVAALVRNSAVFVLVTGFTYLLVKSVRDEVRRREEVQALAKQLKTANTDLAAANQHLKELDERKDEFISIVSHQLRTPVAVLKGYVSLMQEGVYGPLTESMREKVDNMMLMNERLVQMIDNMLNVTRIEKNRIEFSCAMVDVRPVLQQVTEQLVSKARSKGLSLGLQLPASVALEAFVDYEKLVEILTNLVDNAIKYSASGTITVSAEAQPKKRSVVVMVADEGYGMSPSTTKRIFEKFYRSSDPEVMAQGGTGLGLYVCAMFVRGMGGEIWVERTAPGKGTTFAFALPTLPGGQCAAPLNKVVPKANAKFAPAGEV